MSTALFGAPEWQPRSGRTIKVGQDNTMHFYLGNGYLAPNQVMDAEEFFQAKRDAELGRWRWPENPDYVVYPNPDVAFERMFGPNLDLVILRESDAMTKGYVRVEDQGGPPMDHRVGHILAACAYFEAHPARKPWEDAKTGEVWLLTKGDTDGEFAAVVSDPAVTGTKEFDAAAIAFEVDDRRITAGRRIWPVDELTPAELHAASSQAGLASIRGGL